MFEEQAYPDEQRLLSQQGCPGPPHGEHVFFAVHTLIYSYLFFVALQVLRDVKPNPQSALGLRVMKSLMDEVSYEIVPGERNRLRLLKRIQK